MFFGRYFLVFSAPDVQAPKTTFPLCKIVALGARAALFSMLPRVGIFVFGSCFTVVLCYNKIRENGRGASCGRRQTDMRKKQPGIFWTAVISAVLLALCLAGFLQVALSTPQGIAVISGAEPFCGQLQL